MTIIVMDGAMVLCVDLSFLQLEVVQHSTGSVSNRKPHLIFRLEVFLTPYTQHGYFAYIELKILQLEAFLSPGE